MTGNNRGMLQQARNLLRRAGSAAQLRAAQAVLFVDEHGLSLRQTAAMLGCSAATVSRLRRQFAAAPEEAGTVNERWGGRRRENLAPDQEQQLLEELARDGGDVAAFSTVHWAYETLLGRPVADSTVYRLLRRHGWRRAGRGRYRRV
jgi:transposase